MFHAELVIKQFPAVTEQSGVFGVYHLLREISVAAQCSTAATLSEQRAVKLCSGHWLSLDHFECKLRPI